MTPLCSVRAVLTWLIGADLVNPELANNDVVNSGSHLPPNVVVATGVEFQVDGTCMGRGERRDRSVLRTKGPEKSAAFLSSAPVAQLTPNMAVPNMVDR